MRFAPRARKAEKAAKAGLVVSASGLAALRLAATAGVPSTMEAEVQAKASTSSVSPGRMRSAVEVMSGPMARSVSGVISGELGMRAW